MSLFFNKNLSTIDQKQTLLLRLAGAFLFLFAIILSLAPAVRLHSWAVAYRWNHWIGLGIWLVCVVIVNQRLARYAPDRDPYLFPVVAMLSGWGLLSIWRLDPMLGMRQSAWMFISFLALAGGLQFPTIIDWLRRYKYFWLTSGLLLTGLTFVLGTYPGGEGPRLWLGCCGLYLQPSEPLKLLLIVYLAAYLADRIPLIFSLTNLLLPTLIMIGSALAMLVIQRDLGAACLFIAIYSIVLYLASHRKRILAASLFILILAGLAGYLLFDVVRLRIDAWWNPWLDPSGRSYQIVQSLISVAAGGLFGRGPGIGSPGVVPVAHSDFIFASIAEETGLLGAYGILGLFALLVGRGFRIALNATNNFRRYLAAGITTYLVIQGIFIIGGNLRVLPLTGVTLPFVSYGGSSLLTATLSILILILISNHAEELPAPLSHAFSYRLVSASLLAGLMILALSTGWWAGFRSDALLSRTDNPRRGIADRYVQRGSLLDKNDTPIDRTSGKPGALQRVYEYPPLAPVTGYNNPLYGQAGLEAGLDDYLRGVQGNSYSSIFTSHLLYGQSPPGLDIRLSLDLDMQRAADDLLGGRRGALVLINAASGEILVIASHPYFDPNQLETKWLDLIQDPAAPLLNRATLGKYPVETALGPFFLASARQSGQLDQFGLPENISGGVCAVEPARPTGISELVAAGCQPIIDALREKISAQALSQIYSDLGLFHAPDLPMEVAAAFPPGTQSNSSAPRLAGASPMQMALAAAVLTNNGMRPSPNIVQAILTPESGWVPQNHAQSVETVFTPIAAQTIKELAADDAPIWETTAVIQSKEGWLTWYLGGSSNSVAGQPPLALAIILEEKDPTLASAIGRSLLVKPPQP